MKIAVFNDYRIGVVDGEVLVDVTDACPQYSREWPQVFMLPFIAQFEAIRPRLTQMVERRAKTVPLSQATLHAPVLYPTKILAAPVNYRLHQKEMTGAGAVYEGMTLHTVEEYGVFLKPSSSLVGSGQIIELPLDGRRTDHEAEVGVVIGRQGRNILRDEALNYIFGYTGVMDITVRGQEDRTYRKGFDTFTPMGPYVVTADEMTAHDDIAFELTVDGVVRQKSSTRELLFDIPRLIELASYQMTLYPGDIISTGTPAGVGPLQLGNTVELVVQGVGALTLTVVQVHPSSRRGLDR
ncbi:MAG: FAA hydrolase family protein [Sulfobacillus acidophilus]|uniref:FAA hydrolase family protein n=1 Tax=Sulfobacillus acidophilus TaxID=53633 RepID=A0A2T2WHF0_9FIRM|nr:MAG: FAA hydrolase family protein [Sulfobacillus acidophilus]